MIAHIALAKVAIATASALAIGSGTYGILNATNSHTTVAQIPAPTVTITKPPITITPAQTPTSAPTPSSIPVPAPIVTVPVTIPNPMANAESVVIQFYADITDGNYQAAWDLGGSNIGGTDYADWVVAYDTTASINLNTISNWNGDVVGAHLVALQDDGSIYTYDGTYTVENGVIVAANIIQTGW